MGNSKPTLPVDLEPADGASEEEFDEGEAASGAGDLVWDEDESEELRQARRDAVLAVSADSVRAYLKQVGRVALLSAEGEVDLAKRIEIGLFAAERLCVAEEKAVTLTPEFRRDLRCVAREGERAKHQLQEANLRLV
jgi:RNA polymerase primary sigma factor